MSLRSQVHPLFFFINTFCQKLNPDVLFLTDFSHTLFLRYRDDCHFSGKKQGKEINGLRLRNYINVCFVFRIYTKVQKQKHKSSVYFFFALRLSFNIKNDGFITDAVEYHRDHLWCRTSPWSYKSWVMTSSPCSVKDKKKWIPSKLMDTFLHLKGLSWARPPLVGKILQ